MSHVFAVFSPNPALYPDFDEIWNFYAQIFFTWLGKPPQVADPPAVYF